MLYTTCNDYATVALVETRVLHYTSTYNGDGDYDSEWPPGEDTHRAKRGGQGVGRINHLPLEAGVDGAHEQLQVGSVQVLWQLVLTCYQTHACQSGLWVRTCFTFDGSGRQEGRKATFQPCLMKKLTLRWSPFVLVASFFHFTALLLMVKYLPDDQTYVMWPTSPLT